MSRQRMYSDEERKRRQAEAKKRYKETHRAVNNSNQNGAGGNQTKCLANKRLIRQIMGKCEICGMGDWRTTVGHHIIPVGEEGSSDELTNLMCVCRMCHMLLHKIKRRGDDQYYDFINFIKRKRNPEQNWMIEGDEKNGH